VFGKKKEREIRGDMMSTWNQKNAFVTVPRVSRFGVINYFGNARARITHLIFGGIRLQ